MCDKAFLSWEEHRIEVQIRNYLTLDFLKSKACDKYVTNMYYWDILENSFSFCAILIEEVGKENITC